MPSAFGTFHDFCRDSTLPVCNLFTPDGLSSVFGGCELKGIPLDGDRYLRNLGSIVLCAMAIMASLVLLWNSEKKRAAVGRREIQIFLIGYILVSICEIISVGGFPLSNNVRIAFSAVHIALIVSTSWILLLNGIVGYQVIDDGTFVSVGAMVGSSLLFFIATGYVALDTGYNWTGRFAYSSDYKNIALYVLYQLLPLIFIVGFFLLETNIVLRVLKEKKPMIFLASAALLFAIGQIFQYIVSTHICNGTDGKINGAFLETLFTLLSVITLWTFWSSITEDDWPMAV